VSATSIIPSARRSDAPRKVSYDKPKLIKSSSNGIDVKKARPPTAPRSEKKPASTTRVVSSNPTPTSTSAGAQGDDIDKLTSGIKRISIKVPSNEEYAQRQKKGTLADGQKASKRVPHPKNFTVKPTTNSSTPKRISPTIPTAPTKDSPHIAPSNGQTDNQQENLHEIGQVERNIATQYPTLQWLEPNTDPALPKAAQEQLVQQPQPYIGTDFIPFLGPGEK